MTYDSKEQDEVPGHEAGLECVRPWCHLPRGHAQEGPDEDFEEIRRERAEALERDITLLARIRGA